MCSRNGPTIPGLGRFGSNSNLYLANQVKMMTFDNEHELKKIKKLHPDAQGEFHPLSLKSKHF